MLARFRAWTRGQTAPEPVTETPSAALTHWEIPADIQVLFECIADPVFLPDRQGRILAANSQMCAYSGYSLAELLALSVSDILADYDHEKHLGVCNRYFIGTTSAPCKARGGSLSCVKKLAMGKALRS